MYVCVDILLKIFVYYINIKIINQSREVPTI